MSKENRQRSALVDWLVVLLFFCGVALIAAGLRLVSEPLFLVFLGLNVLYLAAGISKAAKTPERTDTK